MSHVTPCRAFLLPTTHRPGLTIGRLQSRRPGHSLTAHPDLARALLHNTSLRNSGIGSWVRRATLVDGLLLLQPLGHFLELGTLSMDRNNARTTPGCSLETLSVFLGRNYASLIHLQPVHFANTRPMNQLMPRLKSSVGNGGVHRCWEKTEVPPPNLSSNLNLKITSTKNLSPIYTVYQAAGTVGQLNLNNLAEFHPLPKIPSEPILEVDLADAGLPPSSCVMCILRNVACTRIGFGASCVQCQLSEPKLCDHVKTIEELIIFHSEIARNYVMTSDVTEVILSEFVASAKRAQTAGMLYREASDDLRVRFRWFIAHVFKCIRLMGTAKFFERFAGAGASLAVQRHVQLLIEQFNWAECPDATRGDTVPVDYTHLDAERFFSTSFDALEVDDFFNLDPEDPFGLIAVGIDETSVPTRPGQLRYPLNDEGPSLSKINNAPSDAEVEPEDEDGEVGTEDGDEETVEGNGTKAAGEDDVEMADAGGEVLEEDGEEAPQSSKKPSSRRSLVTPENQPRPVKKSTRGKSSRRRGR
ncbi:hypothetical protein C8F04DRAFT_1191992 [Mycena alexandri]|uniref:Uncharacterized protein n=1 Tax=Mycena alexandri TaxID=1745969 RepID=A0AAD6SBT0_9AGAR|nr:hypothetical protein C8F04DRAFT_1191992 [Mycena alexandri]